MGVTAVEIGAGNARSSDDGGVLILGGHRHGARTGNAGGEAGNGPIELNCESAIVGSADNDQGVLCGGVAWIGGNKRDRIVKVQTEIRETIGDVFKAVQPIEGKNGSIPRDCVCTGYSIGRGRGNP